MDTLYYAGLSGLILPVPKADLGGGLFLEVTYGHLFAPFMMAFQPAHPGAAHPAPWRAVSAGFATDINCQLVIPGAHTQDGLSDALETAWLVATLLRLRIGPHVRAAMISSAQISTESAKRDEGELWAVEVLPAPLIGNMRSSLTLGDDEIRWLRTNWQRASKLAGAHRDFKVLLEAYSACSWARSAGLALVELWGALQRLFTQGHQEASLRLSVFMSSYLEPPGIERRKLAERIAKLYGARSQGAHGGQTDDLQPLADSANIAARAIIRLIEHEAVPTRDDLFDMLYGV